jgi:hypothetical protein
MISSKAVIKNWSIRDMVLERKGGDIIDTPKSKTFDQGLNAEGQRSDRMRSATENSIPSPVVLTMVVSFPDHYNDDGDDGVNDDYDEVVDALNSMNTKVVC